MSDVLLYTYPQKDGKYRLKNTLAVASMKVKAYCQATWGRQGETQGEEEASLLRELPDQLGRGSPEESVTLHCGLHQDYAIGSEGGLPEGGALCPLGG